MPLGQRQQIRVNKICKDHQKNETATETASLSETAMISSIEIILAFI